MDEGRPMSATGSPFTSSIFSIYAGPTKKQFLVHSTILAKSPTLRAIVEGEWKESANRRIDLEEWDEQTVEQLVQWLYSGHYTWLEVASEAAVDHPVDHRSTLMQHTFIHRKALVLTLRARGILVL
ncbi:MAG: hypothetical protein Q9208_007078 [Pyrenodesmia sp. 3 TL-2023]